MTHLPPPIPFATLARRYRVVLFDAYGVLNDAGGLLPGVADALADLVRDGPPFFVLTNDASQTPATLARKYVHPRAGQLLEPERILCAGLLATEYLRTLYPGRPAAYLGTAESQHFLEAAGSPVVPLDPAHPPDVFLFMDEGGFDWRTEIGRAVNTLRGRDHVALVAPNPDLVFSDATGGVGIGVGALVALMESILGRPFERLGKPGPGLFALGLERARALLPDLAPAEVLMVGDTPATDVVGAHRAGVHACLVLSGNTPLAAAEAQARDRERCPHYVVESVGGGVR